MPYFDITPMIVGVKIQPDNLDDFILRYEEAFGEVLERGEADFLASQLLRLYGAFVPWVAELQAKERDAPASPEAL